MKKYKIALLTPQGPVTEIYTDDINSSNFETLGEFEKRMIDKYGTFVMLNAKEIKP